MPVIELLSRVVGAAVAHADDFSIVAGIPGPLSPEDAGPLGFLQNAYLLSLGIAGLLALGSVAYGAGLYMVSSGKPDKLADAWDRILQAGLGVLLLVGTGTILTVVNPGMLSLELPKLAPVEQAQYSAVNIEKGIAAIKEKANDSEYQRVTGGRCQTVSAAQSAYCNPEALSAYAAQHNCTYRGQPWDGTFMSIACRQESSARTQSISGTDRCNNGDASAVGPRGGIGFSGGLFQVNIMGEYQRSRNFPSCVGVMAPISRTRSSFGSCSSLDSSLGTCTQACKPVGSTWYCPMRACGVSSMQKYEACLGELFNPENNLAAACSKYRAQGTSAWAGTASLIANTCNR